MTITIKARELSGVEAKGRVYPVYVWDVWMAGVHRGAIALYRGIPGYTTGYCWSARNRHASGVATTVKSARDLIIAAI